MGRALLRLKANGELFNLIQQSSLLLLFSSSLLTYFAYKSSKPKEKDADTNESEKIKNILRIATYVMWSFTFIISLIVVLTYIQETGYRRIRNAWGETTYERKHQKQKQLSREEIDQYMVDLNDIGNIT